MSQGLLFDSADVFCARSTTQVTFKGKLGLPIHRWYRLTPSFSPQLALDIAQHFHLSGKDRVLDPFSGVGTVPVCMKYTGIPSGAIELNPYLFFVSAVKTRTYHDVGAVKSCFETFLQRLRPHLRPLKALDAARQYLDKHAALVPPIHRPGRWWSPCNLAQLVAIRRHLLENLGEYDFPDLLRMAVLAILVPISNAKHNHVSLTFADRPQPPLDVWGVLAKKLRDMAADLENVRGKPCAEVQVFRGNSKLVSRVLPRSVRVSAVITSPPYPNRFSYARETRPHMFFFDFIPSAKAVGQLETEAIGGTWGKATSVLAKGVEPTNEVVASLLRPYTGRIGESGRLMANYVTKYFNDMYSHAKEIASVCRPKARLAYVIGNSKFYGHPLPSDEILAAIFGHFGFTLEAIHKMRRRQSKSGLYEALLLMRGK